MQEAITMNSFEKAYAFTMQNEGGYVNDSDDKGGETYKGISTVFLKLLKTKYPERFGKYKDVTEISEEDRQFAYQKEFWEAAKADDIQDETLSIKIFDFAVNFGISDTTQLVQAACNSLFFDLFAGIDVCAPVATFLKTDGVFGQKTLSAVNSFNPNKLLAALICLAMTKYRCIAKANKTQEENLDGWIARAKRMP